MHNSDINKEQNTVIPLGINSIRYSDMQVRLPDPDMRVKDTQVLIHSGLNIRCGECHSPQVQTGDGTPPPIGRPGKTAGWLTPSKNVKIFSNPTYLYYT